MKKHAAAALLMVLTLTGCASPKSDAPPTVADTPAAKLPVGIANDAFKRVTFNSTTELTAPGLYFINVESGKVEGWLAAAKGPEASYLRLSADSRWIIADEQGRVTMLDRTTGTAYAVQRSELQVIATSAGHVVVQEVKNGKGTAHFHVTDEAFKVKWSFTITDVPDGELTALVSPDGTAVAVTVFRQAGGAGETPVAKVYLAEKKSGGSHELDPRPDSLPGGALSVQAAAAGAGEFLVSYASQAIEPSGLPRTTSLVRRYDWQGNRLAEFTLDGTFQKASPDGKLLLTYADLDHLSPAALVSDAAGKPLFRVAGLGGTEWLADGSAVLVGSFDKRMVVTRTGDLKPAPAIPKTESWAFDMSVQPSPDDPNRFIAGMGVVDAAGKLLYEVKLPMRNDWLVQGLLWGASSQELMLRIVPPMGKGNLGGGDFPIAPRVQKAPFADPWILQVDDPKGECLNLRSMNSTSGSVDRCLPSGTKLAVGDLSQAPQKMSVAYVFENNQYWFWVRTEQGETGWVSGSTGSLRWSD